MVKLGIIGAGHLGEQIAHYAKLNDIIVVGFFDDTLVKGNNRYGIEILGGKDDVVDAFNSGEITHVILALGYKHLKAKNKIQTELSKEGIVFGNIICKEAYIDPSAEIGNGVFIMPGVIVDQRAKIGHGVVINCNVTVSHDVSVGDYCFVGPASTLCGFVNVGAMSFLGANCTIIDNLNIESEVKIAAGSVIIKDCEGKSTYIGVPAIKK